MKEKKSNSFKTGYIIAAFAVLTTLMLTPPALRALEKGGVLENVSAGIQLQKPDEADTLGGVKYAIEDTYTNYIPFYTRTVTTYNDLLRTLNAPFSKLFSTVSNADPLQGVASVRSELLKTNDERSYYLITVTCDDGSEYRFEDTALKLTPEQAEENAKAQAEAVNRLYRANKDVNFCLYVASRMQDTEWFDSVLPLENSYSGQYAEFFALLDDGIVYDDFKLLTLSSRREKVWLTDHHWNQTGSREGYEQIIELLRKKAPQILPARQPVGAVHIEGAKFYGSCARACANSSLWDEFFTYDYGLPEHFTDPEYSWNERVKTLSDNPPTSLSDNMYGMCYRDIRKLSYDNHTGRNLLVIGDSYVRGIIDVLASNFDNTYAYFLFDYPHMDYNKVIEENNITDVLIIEYSERLVFNCARDCNLNSINVGEN